MKCGKSVQEIADEIGVHRNTIYNELKRGRYTHRNSDWTEEERYSPDIAEAAYREHLAAKGPDLKIGKDYRLAEYIERRIVEDGYSPAAVLGEIKVKGIQFNTTICEATLYSYIKKGVFLTLEMVHLPQGEAEAPLHEGQEEQEGRQGVGPERALKSGTQKSTPARKSDTGKWTVSKARRRRRKRFWSCLNARPGRKS